jgi:hypothetical protein
VAAVGEEGSSPETVSELVISSIPEETKSSMEEIMFVSLLGCIDGSMEDVVLSFGEHDVNISKVHINVKGKKMFKNFLFIKLLLLNIELDSDILFADCNAKIHKQ